MSDERDPDAEADEPKKPRIVVDEDWKEQVEQEREQLRQQQQQPEGRPSPDPSPSPKTPETPERPAEPQASEPPPQAHEELPPAGFDSVLELLATQALLHLGAPGPPGSGVEARPPDPPTAKLFIDMLGVLEEKTQGNLTPEESQTLQSLLHQLRMAYVAAVQSS